MNGIPVKESVVCRRLNFFTQKDKKVFQGEFTGFHPFRDADV